MYILLVLQEPLLVSLGYHQLKFRGLLMFDVCNIMTLGSFCGKLSSFRGSELGSIVIQDALKRCSINPEDVSEVIMGQVTLFYPIFSVADLKYSKIELLL